MERVDQHQELNGKYIVRFGDNYEQLYREQMEYQEQYHAWLIDLESQRHAPFYPPSSL